MKNVIFLLLFVYDIKLIKYKLIIQYLYIFLFVEENKLPISTNAILLTIRNIFLSFSYVKFMRQITAFSHVFLINQSAQKLVNL